MIGFYMVKTDIAVLRVRRRKGDKSTVDRFQGTQVMGGEK